jgi:hypothetical protein
MVVDSVEEKKNIFDVLMYETNPERASVKHPIGNKFYS